jgi:hypothetical protein
MNKDWVKFLKPSILLIYHQIISHWIKILMQKSWTISLLFASLIVAVLLCPSVNCMDSDSEQSTKQDDTSNVITSNTTVKNKKVVLLIRINTPNNLRAQDSCRVYPYPVAPPHRKAAIQDLQIKDAALRSVLQSLGYTAVSRLDKPFPAGGWRMQYALKSAIAKSGLGLPHTVFTMYVWMDEMVPYLRQEVLRINAIEAERNKRYLAAERMFNDHRADLEVEAFNNGLFPLDVPLRPWHGVHKLGRVELQQTNWWIVALHKTPGLKYYWLWPVKLSDAPEQFVELNEENAIHIDGSW